MVVAIPNYRFTFKLKGKPVFVPSRVGRRIGEELKAAIEDAHIFDDSYFHLRRGGHVAALHHHRESAWFARLDISRFFYSVSRRRVQSALQRIGVRESRFFAKWSTVRNPYGQPEYALPYGFVQSPILASLVIATSEIGLHLRALEPRVKVSIYMDDIALSGGDRNELQLAYDETIALMEREGFAVSPDKARPPAQEIDIFNCDLSTGRSAVRDARIEAFLAGDPSETSEVAFVAYCASVEEGNRRSSDGVPMLEPINGSA